MGDTTSQVIAVRDDTIDLTTATENLKNAVSSIDLKTPADMMLQVIIDAVQKKPQSGTEAMALFAYIMERDIAPLISKLKTWVIAELKHEEGILVQKALDKFKKLESLVEAKCGGCLPM
jgi:hypothetical protein